MRPISKTNGKAKSNGALPSVAPGGVADAAADGLPPVELHDLLQAMQAMRLPLYDVHWTPAVVLEKKGGEGGGLFIKVGLADGRIMPLSMPEGINRRSLGIFQQPLQQAVLDAPRIGHLRMSDVDERAAGDTGCVGKNQFALGAAQWRWPVHQRLAHLRPQAIDLGVFFEDGRRPRLVGHRLEERHAIKPFRGQPRSRSASTISAKAAEGWRRLG